MFGSHLSIAGGMHNALLEAERLKLDCVQVFTKNQQQWKSPPLAAEAIEEWKVELGRLGWGAGTKGKADPGRIVSHASYLANLASVDPELRDKSIALMREEIERCEALSIGLLVFHPGAHTTATREEGIDRIAGAAAELLRATRGYRTVLCFENVAGAGSTIGRTFEELAELRRRTLELEPQESRVGFCIDTCHAHAAGYDLSSPKAAAEALSKLDEHCGSCHVRVLHLNDSKAPAGSRRDRHEHITKGTIGACGFSAFLAFEAFSDIPKILETPKGKAKSGADLDTLNLRRLRALAGQKPRTRRPRRAV